MFGCFLPRHLFLLLFTLLLVFATVACEERQPGATATDIPTLVTGGNSPTGTPTAPGETAVATVMVTVVVSPTLEPVATPTEETAVVATMTAVPTTIPTPPAAPTATATATATTTTTAIATHTPQVVGPNWLNYVNLFRQQANLPLLFENTGFTVGSVWHSTYMVKTDEIKHSEDPANDLFREEGDIAARNGNLAASSYLDAPYQFAFDYWMSAPFHAVPLLDPALHEVGFGMFREEGEDTQFSATIDVRQGVGDIPEHVTFPVMFPRDEGETWVVRHRLFEFPNPLANCPDYQKPTGPPIILQIGPGDQTPRVTSHSFRKGEMELDHCLYDETTYVNSVPYEQDLGRLILDERDAIVIMPRQPLEMETTYTVSIVVNGELISWSFKTVRPPE